MQAVIDWAVEVRDLLFEQLSVGANIVPGLIGAMLILAVGWLLARGVRKLLRRIADGANSLLARAFPSGRLAGVRISPRIAGLLGEIGFFSVVVLTLAASARVAGLRALSGWLERVAVYLPNLIIAFAIVTVGYLVGIFVREQLARSSRGAGVAGQRTAAARLAQASVLAVALVVALGQLGLDLTLLTVLMAICFAAVAVTFGMSIALGSRHHVSNLLGVRAAKDRLASGLTVRVDGVTGRVVELSDNVIVLETDEGTALVPGRMLSEHVTVILAADSLGDDDE